MKTRIREFVKAGYPVLAIRTYEPERFVKKTIEEIKNTEWRDHEGQVIQKKLYHWDLVRGFRELGNGGSYQEADPFALPDMMATSYHAIWFLSNYHLQMQEPPVIQGLRNNMGLYETKSVTVIIVCPDIKVPEELAKDIKVEDFTLPDDDDLRAIMMDLAEETGVKITHPERVIRAASGLTWAEAKNAMTLALVKTKDFDSKVITEIKAAMIKQAMGLEYSFYEERFTDVIGNENAKRWLTNRFKNKRPGLPCKGIIMVGHPGCGKTMLARAMANEVGQPCISGSLSECRGSLVGETEKNTKQFFKMVQAMAPCILVLDELEKTTGNGRDTHETTMAQIGIALQEIEKLEDVFIMATCNDFQALANISNGALVRAGRFDAIFFVGLPSKADQTRILENYLQNYVGKALKDYPELPDLDGYSGSEIRQVAINIGFGEDMAEAARNVVPLSRSQRGQIEALNEWAKDRTIPAHLPEVEPEVKGKRRVQIN